MVAAVGKCSSATGEWADTIVGALHADTAPALNRQIQAALTDGHLESFSGPTEQALMHGVMLGALDSAYEVATNNAIDPPEFAKPKTLDQRRLAAEGGGPRIKGFSTFPYADAVTQFLERQVVTRRVFDALNEKAKLRAFTVARMSSLKMIRTVQRELARQVARGADLRDFRKFAQKRLESAGWTPANKSHVESIFRTNVQSAYTAGRVEHAMKPSVVKARPYWQVVTANDGPPRQRVTHQALHLRVLRADNPIWATKMMPWGHNCFLPGTLIRGPVQGASRALYSGKAVEITTAKGRRLTVTANHPILTREGFVPAQALRQGSELISYGGESGIALLGRGAQRNEYEAPARAEDVFRALAQATVALTTWAGSDDFHGEASRFQGQVEVVGAYGLLLHHGQSALPEQLHEFVLEAANLPRLGKSTRDAALGALSSSSASEPGSFTLATDTVGPLPDCSPLYTLRLGLPTQLDSLLTEDASDGLTADAELSGKLLERGAGLVAQDQVLNLREFEFDGHVYDFQTVNGWLAAAGVVASNCRCRFRTLPSSYDGPVDTDLPGVPDAGFTSGVARLLG